MSITTTLIYGLILMTQVDVISSASPGFCLYCKDYLNQVQCSAMAMAGCAWANSACSGSPNISSPSNTTTTTPGAMPTCASRSNTTCYGMDGSSTVNQCYVNPSGSCGSFANNAGCTTYTSNVQCSLVSLCLWTPTNSSGNISIGACSQPGCSSFQNNASCSFIMTSMTTFTSQPCKWTSNTTNTSSTGPISFQGTCGNGQASDLQKAYCMNLWYTYSDSASVCTYCTESMTAGSAIIQSVIFSLVVAALTW